MTKTYRIVINEDRTEHVEADKYRTDDNDRLHLYRDGEDDPVFTAQYWWSIEDTRGRQDSG